MRWNRTIVSCLVCGREFWVRPSDRTSGRDKYCGMACYRARPLPSPEDMLWRKVDRSDTDGCHPYVGRLDKDGYGLAYDARRGRGEAEGSLTVRAHILAWEFANERDVPEGMCVCHTCDNRRCCNPAHLWLGTQADNVADMVGKGRNAIPTNRARGTRHRAHKLSEDQVREIRARRAAGESRDALAAEFGVIGHAIYLICSRKLWKHID